MDIKDTGNQIRQILPIIKEKFFYIVNNKNFCVFLILLFVGFAVYANIVNGAFLFDDNNFIKNNVYTISFSKYFLKYFVTNLDQGSAIYSGYVTPCQFYRPLQQFFHGIIYSLSGEKPYLYHAFSILLHCINAFLVFTLFKKLDIKPVFAFAGSLIFLLHPVLIQAVSYISGVSEVLCTLFILLGLIFCISYIQKNKIKYFFLSLLMLIFAFMSKENAVVFPLLAAGVWFFIKNAFKDKRFYLTLAAYALLALCYMLFRKFFLGFENNLMPLVQTPYTQSLWVRLVTFCSVIPEYLKLIVFPVHLFHGKLSIWYLSLFSLKPLVGFLILIFSAAGGFFALKKHKTVSLGIWWFWAAMLPFIGIFPLNDMFLEHWLYMPLIGLCLLSAYAFENVKRKNLFTTVLAVILLLFSFRIVTRNLDWKDELRFHKNEIKNNVYAMRSYAFLANDAYIKGNINEAKAIMIKMINLNNRRKGMDPRLLSGVYISLGRIYEEENDYDTAQLMYRRAQEVLYKR